MEMLYFIIFVLSWLALVAVRAVRIESSNVSHYELQRRAKKKQKEAINTIERESRLPDLRGLRYAMEALLLVVFVALAIAIYGFERGLVYVLIGLLLAPFISRQSFVIKRVQKFYNQREESLIALATKWHPFLKWLQIQNIVPLQRIHSRDEYLHLARQSNELFSREELSLLEHGLNFHEKIVSEVMTPQSVIDYAEEDEVVGAIVLDRLHKTGHSRFPVIRDDINHIVGTLYMRDLVPLDKQEKTVKQSMSPEVYYIRNDQTLEYALYAFLRTHHHLFIVVNEYRETVGLLSLEDVVEALLGRKIIDEFDAFADLRAVAESNSKKNNQPKKHEDV